MRIFSAIVVFSLLGGICLAAAPVHFPTNSPSPVFGQAIWEIIMQKIAILGDFPATDRYAKIGYWAGITSAISGFVAIVSFYFLLNLMRNNGQAVLILSLFALILVANLVYSLAMPLAIIFSGMALRRIKKRPDEYGGKKFAVWGLFLALIWSIASIIYLFSVI